MLTIEKTSLPEKEERMESPVNKGGPFSCHEKNHLIIWGGVIIFCMGVIELFSWIIDVPHLTCFGAGYIPMSPGCSFGAIVLGSTLLIYILIPESKGGKIYSLAVLGFISAATTLNLIHFFTGFNTNIVERFINGLLPVDPAVFGASPTSPITAFNFLTSGLSFMIFLIGRGYFRKTFLGGAAFLTLAINFVILIGYIFESPLFYGSRVGPVAIATSLVLSITGLCHVCIAGPTVFPLRNIGGALIRQVLTRAFLVIISVHVVSDGILYHVFNALGANPSLEYSGTIFVAVGAALAIATRLSAQIGGRIERAEQERDKVEMELRRHKEDLEGMVQERMAEIISINERLEKEIVEREKVEEAFREKEHLVQKILTATPNIHYIYDLNEQRLITINPQVEKVLGFSASQMLNMGRSLLQKIIHPDDIPRVLEHHRILSEYSGESSLQLIYRVQHKDGSWRWSLSHDIPYSKTANGKTKEILGTAHDITHLKEIEETLARQSFECERSNKDLEHFVYAISHDLQEPLEVLAGFTQLLEKRLRHKLDKEENEFIGYVVDGSRRMQKMIDGLLHLSRINRLEQTSESVRCEEALKSAVENLKPKIEETKAVITHDPLPVIYAHPALVAEVFQNLLSNAIKFHGEEPPKIHVAAVRMGDEWKFSMKDNGIGVPAEYQNRIFDLFYRIDSTDTTGAGMGLATCKKIIDRYGGRIWVESIPGEGSTFYFRIPQKGEKLPITYEI